MGQVSWRPQRVAFKADLACAWAAWLPLTILPGAWAQRWLGHPCTSSGCGTWVLGHSPAPATVAGEFWHTSPRFSFPPCYATVTSRLFFSFCNAFRVSLTVILKGISTFFFPIRIMKTVGAIVGHCSTSHTLCLIPVPGTPNHTTDAALITSPGQAVILLGWRKDMK